MNNQPGFFLTIEGIEGAGKSTLASLLQQSLTLAGFEVLVTAEPGGDGVGNRIRQLVLDSSNLICDRAELLLFEAARAQHVDMTIRPALKQGLVVISDRFADSSIAYQGYARGIDLDIVKMLNDYAVDGVKPDLTILLDLPVESGLARQEEIDRVSLEKLAFHEAVRQGFLTLANEEPGRIIVIDATLDLDEVLRQALAAIAAHGLRAIEATNSSIQF